MVKRMLIDATHSEETRVVVLDGTRLDEFDVETSTKKQNKGNIYLAKVVRVEPSLQAAFVDYGGNRHGFLAFSEIHPDYYQIPVADREKLLAEVRRQTEQDEETGDGTPESAFDRAERYDQVATQPEADGEPRSEALDLAVPTVSSEPFENAAPADADPPAASSGAHEFPDLAALDEAERARPESEQAAEESRAADESSYADPRPDGVSEAPAEVFDSPSSDAAPSDAPITEANAEPFTGGDSAPADYTAGPAASPVPDQPSVEQPVIDRPSVDTVGGEDEAEDDQEDRQRRRFLASRHYKIQEVIKRRQIMLVQVVKEERGNKGAALTTYLSLAGRYCVLMPNSARGGGVSRKITSAQDRRRLKSIISDLELPKTMAVILRTAGSERSKQEIRRDYEYLLRTWDSIRESTMRSRAPALIHEEASLIKRAIRDVYSRDIEEVLVDGEDGFRVAKEYMRMLTPSHAKKVVHYGDAQIPLFHRYQVESQLESMNQPMVQLRSGGSIVFGQTEALVAIDVNSGRATRERHIEETALKTNLEAADEIARQLRLRDLAGLIVIDFIDMEDNRNNHAVERRLKEALKIDRARIQVGRISHFGLLELSRQRLRPSLIETNFRPCAHCGGTGHIRSTESSAIYTLRMIEEEGARKRSSELTVTVHPDVALYLLNHKREAILSLEARYQVRVLVHGDGQLVQPNFRIDRIKATRPFDEPALQPTATSSMPPPIEIDEPEVAEEEEEEKSSDREADDVGDRGESRGDGRERDQDGRGEFGGRKRRRRRRGRGRDRQSDGEFRGDDRGQTPREQVDREFAQQPDAVGTGETNVDPAGDDAGPSADGNAPRSENGRDEQGRDGRRRRGRRGGRRRRREFGDQPQGEIQGDRGSEVEESRSAVAGSGDTEHSLWSAQPGESAEQASAPSDDKPSGASRLFRAIKETALSWTRAETKPETVEQPAPEPVSQRREPEIVREPAPAVIAAPTPPPPLQPPPPRPVSPPPPLPPEALVIAPDAPLAGPPKRGWWSQPKT